MARHTRNLRDLLADLLSRGVVQTVGLYLVAAWATIEVVSTVFPYLGLSDRAVTATIVLAALGVPLVTALAWMFEVTPEGVRRAEAPEASSPPVVRIRWGRLPLIVSAVIGVGSVGALVWTRIVQPRTPDLGSVAVLPFEVRGDTAAVGHLGEGLVTLLSRELDGVAGMRGADPLSILSRIDRRGDVPISPELARSVATEVGAGRFIMGTVTELEGQLDISAALYSATAPVEPVYASVQGALGVAFELAERLVVELLAQQVGPLSREFTRAAARHTESLAAFKAFVDGERDLRATRRTDALAAFQRAVAEDSTFALAHYRLAVTAGLARNYRLVESSVERAQRFADRLGDRDRRLLEAFAVLREGRIDDGEARYRELIEDYPEAWEARFHLGELLTEHNPARGRPASEGLPFLERVARVDPAFVCPTCTLANHALSVGDIDRADSIQYARVPRERFLAYAAASAAARGDTLELRRLNDPPRAVFWWQGPWVAAWFERYELAEEMVAAMTTPPLPDAMQAHGLFILADLHVARGRWGAAETALDRARVLAPGRTMIRRAFYLTQPLAEPEPASVERSVTALRAWSGTDEGYPDLASPLAPYLPLGRRYLLGLLEAERGRAEAALAWADSLAASPDPDGARGVAADLAMTIRADVALRREQPSDALRTLEGVKGQIPVPVMDLVSTGPARVEYADLFTEEHARLLRIAALMALDRPGEARRWVENGFFRIGGNAVLAPTLRKLEGDVYATLGEAERARDRYARFVRLWDGADPALRHHVDGVRAQLVRLEARE